MKIKFKNKKKKQIFPLQDENYEEKYKEEENLPKDQSESEQDGKIIFLYKKITPHWLIEELSSRLRCDKYRKSKGGVLPA